MGLEQIVYEGVERIAVADYGISCVHTRKRYCTSWLL